MQSNSGDHANQAMSETGSIAQGEGALAIGRDYIDQSDNSDNSVTDYSTTIEIGQLIVGGLDQTGQDEPLPNNCSRQDLLNEAKSILRQDGHEQKALDLLEKGFKRIDQKPKTARRNELKKRYFQEITRLVRAKPTLNTTLGDISEYENQKIHLTRTVRVPNFDDIDAVVGCYSQLRRFVDHEKNKGYFRHLDHLITRTKSEIQNTSFDDEDYILVERFENYFEEISEITKKDFGNKHGLNIEVWRKYYSKVKYNIETRWKEKFKNNRETFFQQGYTDNEFHRSKFVNSEAFSKLDRMFENEFKLTAFNTETSISTWAFKQRNLGHIFTKQFELTENLDESPAKKWNLLYEYLLFLRHVTQGDQNKKRMT